MVRGLFLLLILGLCIFTQAGAQIAKPNQDSLRYSRFEAFSQKTKVTRFLHKLLIKSLKPISDTMPRPADGAKTFRFAEGKIIRAIHILTFDPFGYYMRDTTILPSGLYSKTGNALHIKTRPFIIKNLLLFNRYEPFDSLLVMESERLLYTQKYLRDVVIYATTPTNESDSVDVFVSTYDIWSIAPAGNISASAVETGLTDINFGGLGHRLQANVKWRLSDQPNTTRLSYFVPNISNTYISSKVEYILTGKSDSVFRVELARAFYSPATKWAGGVLLGQMKIRQAYVFQDSLHNMFSRVQAQDYWGARSFPVQKGYTRYGTENKLIVSGRLLRLRYSNKTPEAANESLFIPQTFLFTGVGFTSRKYIRDSYIFDYSRLEFVPVGQYYGLTFGVDAMHAESWYFGAKAAMGNYYSFGYLSVHLEYGSHLVHTGFQQGAFTGRINYFTKLYHIGRWRIRQFVKPIVTIGINRLSTDNLTFSDDLKGFEAVAFKATSMIVLTLQTQSYSPWNFIGFRFGPYLFSSIGLLANQSSGVSENRVFAVLGLGVLIKNDYLVFNTFQISLSFYPSIPGKGTNVFKLNSFETSDYGFRGFELDKPGVVEYR
jgi:hypothetical protein